MQIISRIRLPQSTDSASLYIRCDDSLVDVQKNDQIHLPQNTHLSFNTYFNSFYESFYTRYTELKTVFYVLKLAGDFVIAGYRESDTGDRTQVFQQEYYNCQPSNPVKIELNLLQDEAAGRIYLELTSLVDGRFEAGWLATEQPTQPVSLAIISCTYKKEAYIQKTVDTILADPLLQNKSFKIFVVDNGKTLNTNLFTHHQVQLIPNRNFGGSGGFTRGLVEALQEGHYSHFLFMDDDVELDSEVIYKLFSVYEFAQSDFAIAGAMLDLHKKHLLFEAGANYSKHQSRKGFAPFEIASLKTEIDLRDSQALNSLLLEEPIDYGAFWFFAFPKTFVEAMGLPLPLFIKGDDLEFGLRISKQLRQKIVAFPAISVWHEPFYLKFPVWDTYYYFRNILVAHAIHGSLSYFDAIKNITTRLIYTLLFFDYNSAGMLVKAFEDYIQGPDFIRQNDPEQVHTEVVRLSKFHQNQSVDYNFVPPAKMPITKAGLLQRILSLVTLNGHLLPDFLISREDAFVWLSPGNPGQRSRAFAKKRVLIFKEESACLYKYEMNQAVGLGLLRRWFQLAWKGCFQWSNISHAWKNSAPEFVSAGFWKKYLNLEQVGESL